MYFLAATTNYVSSHCLSDIIYRAKLGRVNKGFKAKSNKEANNKAICAAGITTLFNVDRSQTSPGRRPNPSKTIKKRKYMTMRKPT